jgi:hypothetical protein
MRWLVKYVYAFYSLASHTYSSWFRPLANYVHPNIVETILG